MRETITTELLRRLQQAPPTAVLDIYDTKVRRLVLRVRPTGMHSYRIALGRGRWYTLGGTDLIPSPALARAEAQKRLGDYASGADPRVAKRAARQLTFTDYLDQVYAPWLSAHQRTGDETVARLKTLFAPSLGPLNLRELSAWQISIEATDSARPERSLTCVDVLGLDEGRFGSDTLLTWFRSEAEVSLFTMLTQTQFDSWSSCAGVIRLCDLECRLTVLDSRA